MEALATIDWQDWLRRWDAMQMTYIPDREARFSAMFDALEAALPPSLRAAHADDSTPLRHHSNTR